MPIKRKKVAAGYDEARSVWVRKGGIWERQKRIANTVDDFLRVEQYTFTSDYDNADMFALFGSPTYKAEFIVVVESGVAIGSTNTANAAMDFSGFPAGSIIRLINKGHILGMGGAGGAGGAKTNTGCANSAQGTNGEAGGPALEVDQDITIENELGQIWGGGGGGGGGRAEAGWCVIISQTLYCFAWAAQGGGGGAGGGAGGCNGACALLPVCAYCICSSEDGTGGAAGVGGTQGYWSDGVSECLVPDAGYNFCAAGGDYAEAGANGITVGACTNTSTGGAAGKAIEPNGNTITWVSGSSNVKGAVS